MLAMRCSLIFTSFVERPEPQEFLILPTPPPAPSHVGPLVQAPSSADVYKAPSPVTVYKAPSPVTVFQATSPTPLFQATLPQPTIQPLPSQLMYLYLPLGDRKEFKVNIKD